MPSSSRGKTQINISNPDYVDSVWQETTVEELKAFFGINILMPQNKLY